MAGTDNFKPALLVVDMQEDFCPPNGSLAVDGGRDIAPGINKMLALPFAAKIATRDWHPPNHASFASNHSDPNVRPFVSKAKLVSPLNADDVKESTLWPDHCVQNTPGADIIPEINPQFDTIVLKGQHEAVEMYSAFSDIFGGKTGVSIDLAGHLRDQGITHVYTCGLAGEICVFENALDAKRKGFEVVYLQDLMRAVDQDAMKSCMKRMEDQGIKVVESTGPEVERVRQLRR